MRYREIDIVCINRHVIIKNTLMQAKEKKHFAERKAAQRNRKVKDLKIDLIPLVQ